MLKRFARNRGLSAALLLSSLLVGCGGGGGSPGGPGGKNDETGEITHRISVVAVPAAGGVVSGGGSYAAGDTATIKATPNSGYSFVQWQESGVRVSTEASYSFRVTSSRNLQATFSPTDTPTEYSVGGTVSGLSGTLVLQNGGGDDLAISDGGNFVFATPLKQGDSYEVTIRTQPNGQTCSIAGGSGTVNGEDVTTVDVICVTSVAKSCEDYSRPAWPQISQTERYKTLFEFQESPTPPHNPYGTYPESGLVEGPDGYFYGVNSFGGKNKHGHSADGLVYRLSPGGDMTELYAFEYLGDVGPHGIKPRGGLTLGSDCYLYGTTDSIYGDPNAGATIFKMSLEGEITHLASLYRDIHGTSPFERLLEGSDGNFYGTSLTGGEHYQSLASGTVFKMTPDGTVTTLHHFDGESGAYPRGTLVEGDDGHYYGVTERGGAYDQGTIYRVSSAGKHEILHSFEMATGSSPHGGLAKGDDGSFYGTAKHGGVHDGGNPGVVFKITPAGEYRVLHWFTNNAPELGCNCGVARPVGDLILAQDGFFYGVTELGTEHKGIGTSGTVYRISPAGDFSTVVYFPVKGAVNANGLIQGSDGHLYGTAHRGGEHDRGLIFRILLP